MSDLAKPIAKPDARPGSPPVWLKPFEAGDRPTVFALLSDIPLLYPQGGEWLHRRLLDVASGKARCTLAMSRWNPVGATIESPKDRRRLKLSTVYVHPSFRQRGVGSRLIAAASRQWQRDELDEVCLTADIRRAPHRNLTCCCGSLDSVSRRSNRNGTDGAEMKSFLPAAQGNRRVLISVRPNFASALFAGRKRFEFRRVRSSVRPGDLALVYETAPTSKVVGEFSVGRVISGTLAEIAAYAEEDMLEQVQAYLFGTKTSTAIEALNPSRFASAISLSTLLPGLKAPQSYMFLPR